MWSALCRHTTEVFPKRVCRAAFLEWISKGADLTSAHNHQHYALKPGYSVLHFIADNHVKWQDPEFDNLWLTKFIMGQLQHLPREDLKAFINQQGADGITALHLALQNKQYVLAKYLIVECDADVTKVDEQTRTTLHFLLEKPGGGGGMFCYRNCMKTYNDKKQAFWQDNLDLARLIIDRIPIGQEREDFVNLFNKFGRNALTMAVELLPNTENWVHFLIQECNADVSLQLPNFLHDLVSKTANISLIKLVIEQVPAQKRSDYINASHVFQHIVSSRSGAKSKVAITKVLLWYGATVPRDAVANAHPDVASVIKKFILMKQVRLQMWGRRTMDATHALSALPINALKDITDFS